MYLTFPSLQVKHRYVNHYLKLSVTYERRAGDNSMQFLSVHGTIILHLHHRQNMPAGANALFQVELFGSGILVYVSEAKA
jgi:hypothetical protein